MQYFNNQFDYQKYVYEQNLKKDSSHIGALLIISFLSFSLVGIIATVIMLLSGYSDGNDAQSTVLLLLENGVVSLLCFFIPGLVFCSVKKTDFNKIFPFKKVSPSLLILLSVVGLALAMVSNYATSLLTSVMSWFGIDNSYDMSFTTDTPLSIAVYFISVALVPAFIEEFAFRGVILGSLRKYSDGLAVIVSAAVFGLIHGNFVQIPFAFCGGLIFGALVVKTNSLLPSMILHFLNNALSVFLDIMYSNEMFEENILNCIEMLIMTAIGVAGFICAIILIRKHKELFEFEKSDNTIDYKEKVKIICKTPTMIVFAVLAIIEAVLCLALL